MPGVTYMGSQGNNYAYNNVTFAENEERSPWTPFHVEHGFKASDSTVSVFTGCRSTAFTLGVREKYWREHVRSMLRGLDAHSRADLPARSHHRAPVYRPRRFRYQRETHRMGLRKLAHGGEVNTGIIN